MKKFIPFFAFSLLLVFSCKNVEQKESVVQQIKPTKYTLTPFAPSTQYADAGIAGMVYKDGNFEFNVTGTNYSLGAQTPDANAKNCANSAKGQHIHLIVDNEPYAAKYESYFKYEIEDGEHYLLAFLSRSYHESIKSKKAHMVFNADIKNNSLIGTKNIDKPMLFYSRPKGTYVGDDTKNVMLDFYLVNTSLGNDTKVRALINGEEHIIDNWQPYNISGLEMGENTIELTLIDKNNNVIDTPLNPVSRTFTLKANAEEEM